MPLVRYRHDFQIDEAIDAAVVASGGGDMLAANNLSDVADAATARTNLGIAIGSDVQAYDADLTTWAGLTPSANAQSLITAANYAAMRGLLDLEAGTDFYSIAAADAAFLSQAEGDAAYQPLDAELTTWAGLTPSANAQSLVTAANYAAMRTLLDLEAGTDFYSVAAADAAFLTPAEGNAAYQPLDADLTALAGLVSAADKVPYFTGAGTAAVADFTAYGRTLVALADETALEALLDTLPNLTSIQGRTVTLADAGADALLGWDDTAGAYENLSAAEATAVINAFVGDSGAGGTKGSVPAPASGDGAAGKFLKADGTWTAISGGGDALKADPLSQFAATTSLQLKGVISDETGSGALVFADTPTLVTPVLGTPTSGTLTNCTGLPLAGVTDSTTEALGVGSLEVGHATDSTITRVSAGVLAIEGSNILTAATGQPLDADLTSWAGVTRASGFDTFTATPSSANLAALLTDETGTGANVFGTGPTLSSTTAATTPYTSKNTADGASVAVAVFEGDRATPAANDEIYASFVISDSAGNQDENARITAKATTVTSGAGQAGRLQFGVRTANTLADELYLTGTELSPATSDGLALGSTSLMFSDLYLAQLAVLNFNNGNFTLTHVDGGITASGTFSVGTSNSITAGTIELGAATDTTLSRASAGRLAVEGVTLGITSMTAVASTSGTSIDFTSIPSWVKSITIMFAGVSTNGTSNPLIQIGDSGGIENTGYLGAGSFCGATTGAANYTTGFGINSAAAASVIHGSMTLSLLDAAAFTWTCSANFGLSSSAFTMTTAGSKSLSATLDRVRITTVGGVNTFDAGTINMIYQ